MKSTSFKVEDVLSDDISKNEFSQEQITRLTKFLNKNTVNININIKFLFLKPKQKKKY